MGDYPTMTLFLSGYSKAGKSQLADTAPGPRLIIDTENGTQWTPSRKKLWNPLTEPIPELGPDDSALVQLKDVAVVDQIMTILRSGHHPFMSVIVDSLMELQRRELNSLTSGGQARIQDWGELLRKVENFCAELRDMTMANGESIPVIVVISGAAVNSETGRIEPFMKGSVIKSLPFMFDTQAYLKAEVNPETGQYIGKLAMGAVIDRGNPVQAGTRIKPLVDRYGPVIENPNLSEMYEVLKEAFDAKTTV